MDIEDLAVELLVTSARFTRLASRLTDTGMPRALWRALSQVDELGPLRVSDLAAVDRISQPSATALVRRLLEQGWVTREPDPADARAVLVAITPAGLDALATQRRQAGAALAERLAGLDPVDRERLATGLEVLQRVTAGDPREATARRTGGGGPEHGNEERTDDPR